MRVAQVIVKDWGPLKGHCIWDINPDSNLALLCGQHGVGKSSYLNASAKALTELLTYKTMPLPEDYFIQIELAEVCAEDTLLLQGKTTYEFPFSAFALCRRRAHVYGNRVPFAFVHSETFGAPYSRSALLGMESAQSPLKHYLYESVDLLWVGPSRMSKVDPVGVFALALATMEKERSPESVVDEANSVLKRVVNLELHIKKNVLYCKRPDHSKPLLASYLSEAEYYAIGLVLLGLVILPESAILVLDSPESCLHPAAQLSLIEPIIDRLKTGQVIIATHSPALLTTRPAHDLYILGSQKNMSNPQRADQEAAYNLVRRLYGDQLSDSITRFLSGVSSTGILSYLLECSLDSTAVERKKGDPQIQQLAAWLSGYVCSKSDDEKTRIADIGAGRGDLIDSIRASGYKTQIHYIPVEPDTTKWQSVIERLQTSGLLSYSNPIAQIPKDESSINLAFLVNMLHELDLQDRAFLLSQVLRSVSKNGIVVIHEVTVLPIGEAKFVIWSYEDIKDVFRRVSIPVEIKAASTFTRPGGWPLETICIKTKQLFPDVNELLQAMIQSLPSMLERWTKLLDAPTPNQLRPELIDRYRAFLIAQVANLSVWYHAYREVSVK